MSSEDNKQAARDGYDAFVKGDAKGAMADIADSIEWVVGGDSAVSGTYHGKEEVGRYWGKLVEKGFTTSPHEFIAEGDLVVVLATQRLEADEAESADVLKYEDGKLVRFQSFGAAAILDSAFPK